MENIHSTSNYKTKFLRETNVIVTITLRDVLVAIKTPVMLIMNFSDAGHNDGINGW